MMQSSRDFNALNHIVLVMISAYLLIDSLTGFVGLELGLNLKLSLIYKAPLIIFIILALFLMSQRTALLVLGIFLLFSISPLLNLLRFSDASLYFQDLSAGLKLIMPLITFAYAYRLFSAWPRFYYQYAEKVLMAVSVIIVLNLIVGLAGFGYMAYGTFGITGYFYAGNELGGLLVVAFCFLLQKVWLSHRFWFIPATITCVAVALLVGTKSALLGAILIGILLPLINERQALFRLTKRKLYLFFSFALIALIVAITLYELISEAGLVGRAIWAYNEKGLIGLILSGRDQFASEHISYLTAASGWLHYFIGIGVSGVNLYTYKLSAEVDPVDSFVWFGFLGLLVVFSMAAFFIYFSFSKLKWSAFRYAPAVFVANLLLMALAFTSGHIWTSGMLGIAWAMFNALLVQPDKGSIPRKNESICNL